MSQLQLKKILIIGAGVIGSFNAARLKDAGKDVTLLARGQRLEDLREHGVVLEDARTGRRTTTQVPLVDHLAPDDAYDLAIVVVRRNQIASVLPMLAQNHCIPNILFLGNNAAGHAGYHPGAGPGTRADRHCQRWRRAPGLRGSLPVVAQAASRIERVG